MNKEKTIGSLTIAEFEEFFTEYIREISPSHAYESRKLIKGIDELADYLGVSKSTAQRLKCTGILIPATMQSGRTCLFDPKKIDEVLQSRTAVVHYKRKKK